jgi:hypothetical protein
MVQSKPSLIESTSVAGESPQPVLIPVTGKPHLSWEVLVFYGLIGFAALTLILALLDSANRSTSYSARHKTSQNETDEK